MSVAENPANQNPACRSLLELLSEFFDIREQRLDQVVRFHQKFSQQFVHIL
jgi:hypothetical protein